MLGCVLIGPGTETGAISRPLLACASFELCGKARSSSVDRTCVRVSAGSAGRVEDVVAPHCLAKPLVVRGLVFLVEPPHNVEVSVGETVVVDVRSFRVHGLASPH